MSMIQLFTKNMIFTRSTLHYSLGLTLSVGNGNFDSTHTKDLATDGELGTFASANPASNGDTVTITCMFKNKYHVKMVKTWVTADMTGIKGAIYDDSQSKRGLNELDGNNQQPQIADNMNDKGDRIEFERGGELQLREVEIWVKEPLTPQGYYCYVPTI